MSDPVRSAIPPRYAAAFAAALCAVVGAIGQATAYGVGMAARAFAHPDWAWLGVLLSLGAALIGTVGSVIFFSRVLAALLMFLAGVATFVGAVWFTADTLPALLQANLDQRLGGAVTVSWLMVLACPLFMLASALSLYDRKPH